MNAANSNAKMTICQTIKYEQDIEPFPLVKIYSGVGSGKSYFATRMITGSQEYGIPKQNVLIITSRRSKVEETLREMGDLVSKKITRTGNLSSDIWQTGEEQPREYENFLKTIIQKTDMGEFSYSTYNKSVVCTNAFVSAYLRNVYNPNDPITHIWNKFDAIIIDEVHSLITDATYQSATFDVLSLIHEYLKLYKNNQLQECACKHMILMTGTPRPFEAHVKFDFPEELTNKIDLFDKCNNIVPNNIVMIDEQTSKKQIRELLLSGQNVIYFTNYALSESEVRKNFKLSDTIKIGVSFSNEEKRKNLSEEEQNNINIIDISLSEQSLIPDFVQFFVTTSRNKEGININNPDFHNMFVETHLMYDVVQMAGRVRSGIDNLFIITNAEQFNYGNNLTDILFTKRILVANRDYANSEDDVNHYLISTYLTNEKEIDKTYEDRQIDLMHFVKYIETRFSYVRYNVFEQKFEFFQAKEDAEKTANLQKDKFSEMLSGNDNRYIERWFPKSYVRRELSLIEQAAEYLDNIIGPNKYVSLSKDEFDKHLSIVRELLNTDLTSRNSILHSINEKFNCKIQTNNVILYYGDQDPTNKRKPMGRRKKH